MSFSQSWTTTADQSNLLIRNKLSRGGGSADEQVHVIPIDPAKQFQTVEGFGFTLTGGSAALINRLPVRIKHDLLQELFGAKGNGLDISSLRISIGASDLSEKVFTYDDVHNGKTDFALEYFSLSEDTVDLIPLLREIISINPKIKITASPWTPPLWMKDNLKSVGGKLLTSCYAVYANYFVKYIQTMKAQGIVIDAVTIQNEPQNPHNNPSLSMDADEQRIFVKDHLGPEFEKSGIHTKIIIWDHNCDMPEYPMHILSDPAAAKYVDGTAFHLYAGNVSALSKVHDAYPAKNIYFTEQWTGKNGTFDGDLQWHVRNVIIGTMRNWSKNALEWNLANDTAYGPHTPGGCTECRGALTINGNQIQRNVSYYVIAHASRFVPQGSVRIGSQEVDGISNVAFLTPEGKVVVILLNEKDHPIKCRVEVSNRHLVQSMPAKSVVTLMMKP